jgi:hypothetical protein
MAPNKTGSKTVALIFSLLFTCTVFAAGNGVPGLLPFQGRAVDSSGNPITVTSTVTFRIYPPAGNCYIYEDTQTVTPNAYGIFSALIGSSGNSSGPANAFAQVFNNNSAAVLDSCSGTYSPSSDDWRRLSLIVNGTILPDMQTIGASAFAIHSEYLDGKRATDFVNINGNITQANMATLTGGGDASALHNHDSLYARRDGTSSFTGNVTTTTGSIGVGTTAPTADLQIQKDAPSVLLKANAGSGGDIKIDFFSGATQYGSIRATEGAGVGMKFFSGTNEAMRFDSSANAIFSGSITVAGTLGLGRYTDAQEPALITALTALGPLASGTLWANTDSGTVRFWDGAGPQTLGAGGAGGGGGGSVTSVRAGAGLTGGTITSTGTIALATTGVSAGTYKAVTVDAYGRVTAATNPTTLGGFGITDSVQNGSGVPSMMAGLEIGLPAAGTTGRLYIASDTNKIYRDNGSTWDLLAGADASILMSGTLAAARLPSFSGDMTSAAGSSVLTLADSGVAPGSYKEVVVDSKGRVTSGLSPTTLSGFGITDGVQNAGGTVSFQAGLDGARPGAGVAGRVYIATDTKIIYRDDGSGWIAITGSGGGGGGGVSEVTAHLPLTVATGTTTPDLWLAKFCAGMVHLGRRRRCTIRIS